MQSTMLDAGGFIPRFFVFCFLFCFLFFVFCFLFFVFVLKQVTRLLNSSPPQDIQHRRLHGPALRLHGAKHS